MKKGQEILTWLKGVELSAALAYKKAAEIFKDNQPVSSFFSHLSLDEYSHGSILSEAEKILTNEIIESSNITVSDSVIESIEHKLNNIETLLENKNLKLEELLTKVVEIELSEINEYFDFILLHLKRFNNKYEIIEEKLHGHVQHVIYFINEIPQGKEAVKRLDSLRKTIQNRILYIDSNELTCAVVHKIVKQLYQVDTVTTLEEAEDFISKSVYDIIILSVEDTGIDYQTHTFYNSIKNFYPDIQSRIIIAYHQDEDYDFIQRYNLPSMSKPFSTDQILKSIKQQLLAAKTSN